MLRPFTGKDLAAFHAIHTHPDVTRYLAWQPRTRAESGGILAEKTGQLTLTGPGQTLSIAVELEESAELIGDMALRWTGADHDSGEVAVVLHPRHQGRGYAAEAATELMRLAFDELGLQRIFGRCDSRNIASASLMEGLGMRREAPRRDTEQGSGEQQAGGLVYAIRATQWRRR
jgi:RimJ/RimL family protein N-acetyltransferase